MIFPLSHKSSPLKQVFLLAIFGGLFFVAAGILILMQGFVQRSETQGQVDCAVVCGQNQCGTISPCRCGPMDGGCPPLELCFTDCDALMKCFPSAEPPDCGGGGQEGGGISLSIELGSDISGDNSVDRRVSYTCDAEEPATVNSCTTRRNDFSSYGCSFSLQGGGSCAGRDSCTYECTARFSEGTNADNVTLEAEGMDSMGNTDDASGSIDVHITEPFYVASDGISFTDSGEGVVNPSSREIIIATNQTIGSTTISGAISFSPLNAATISGCSISGSVIRCTLLQKGTKDGKPVYIDPERTSITVTVPYGFVRSVSGKLLRESSQSFTVGCVLRKVTLQAQSGAPQNDVFVSDNDLWGNCDSLMGQEYRHIKLRQLSCGLSEVTEMRIGNCMQTPNITQSILRDDYSDVDILENPLTDARFLSNDLASFGHLGSKITVRGDNFYPYSSSNFTNSQPNPTGWGERTFTEVWMGQVKVAGVGRYTGGTAVDFYQDAKPSCANGLQSCNLRVSLRKQVPECASKLDVRAAVKPLLYRITSSGGFPLWNNGEGEPLQYAIGLRNFVVVPSVKTASGYRGARFTFKRANELIANQFNRYLQGRPINQAPTGLPLTLQMESAYLPLTGSLQEQDMAERSCSFGTDSNDALTNNLCGFGDYSATRIGFYNNTDAGEARSLLRAQKDADFFEVGKTWKRKRVFPLAPFLTENAVSAKVRAYVCGGSIGFIESDNGAPQTSAFQLLHEPFGVHTVLPVWGSDGGGFPSVWGYNLNKNLGNFTASLGGRPVQVEGGTQEMHVLHLADDQQEFTSRSPLSLCRNGYCASYTTHLLKQTFSPAARRLPQIDSATPPSNWHAAPLYSTEDIPYKEFFCEGEEATISGAGFGAARQNSTVEFWMPQGFSILDETAIIVWSDTAVTVRIPVSGSLIESVDCPRGNTDMSRAGKLSEFSLPARICKEGGACLMVNQETIIAPPPARSRIVSSLVQSGNYCLDDVITITGSGFGGARLGAKVKIRGEEVSRYLSWSGTKIEVTPPATFSGKRSPKCPRRNPSDGLITGSRASSLSDFSITCPDIPSGPRDCAVGSVDLISESEPVYAYTPQNAAAPNLCLKDVVRFDPSFPPGSEQGVVSIFSPLAGWRRVPKVLKWSDTEISAAVPDISLERFSPSCPHGASSSAQADGSLPKAAEVSIFTGPLEVCAQGVCHYVPLAETSSSSPLPLWRKEPINKQYWIGPNPAPEAVVIKGRYFEDIRSVEEFNNSAANQTDRRSSAYVEFYSDEFGFVPAYSYQKWLDGEIIAIPPRISVENVYGGPQEGVSVAGLPIRVCTAQGCSTNLSPEARYKNDAGGKRRDKGFWPEALIAAPACLPSGEAAAPYDAALLTVYGKDLHKVESAYIALDDGRGTALAIEPYNNPELHFKEQYTNRIVFKVPTSGIVLPVKSDIAGDEPSVITGKLFLASPFYKDNEGDTLPALETPVAVTFSKECGETTSCIGASYIGSTNNASYGAGNFIESGAPDKPYEYARLEGCNFGETGIGSVAVFGDMEIPYTVSASPSWTKNMVSVNPPQGASSAVAGLRVWTGLYAMPVVWGANAVPLTIGTDTVYSITAPPLFEILPTVEKIAPPLGVTGGIVDIYGSGFCEQGLCSVPPKDIRLGIWQKEGDLEPVIAGAPARIFDYSNAMIRVQVPSESERVGHLGDLAAYGSEVALSGQARVTRSDAKRSRPYFKTAMLGPYALVKKDVYPLPEDTELITFPHYFTRAPAIFDVQPRAIRKRGRVEFTTIDLLGVKNSGTHITPVFDEPPPRLEAWSTTSLVSTPENKRQGKLPFDTLDRFKSLVSDIFPLHFYQFPEQSVLLNNPAALILSNWDGAYALLEPTIDRKKRGGIAALSVLSVQCIKSPALSMPTLRDMPPALPQGVKPIVVRKIDPLPLFDVCAFCQEEIITIAGDAQSSPNFGDSRGAVFFWSDSGWISPTRYVSWSDAQIAVQFVGGPPSSPHPVCPRPSGVGGLPLPVRLPVKICRAVPDGAPEECGVFGVPTHLYSAFSLGRGSKPIIFDTRIIENATSVGLRTYPPFAANPAISSLGRINVPSQLFFAGSNVIEKIVVEEELEGLRKVALFTNSIYNDTEAEYALGKFSVSAFSVFGDGAEPAPLGGMVLVKKVSPGAALSWNKEEWSAFGSRGYTGIPRYGVCVKKEDGECISWKWAYPGRDESGPKSTAYGFSAADIVYLAPDPPVVERIGYVREAKQKIGYLQIRGKNFFGSEVMIDGKKYTSDAKHLYNRVSSSEIRITLPLTVFAPGRHTLRLVNRAYGPSSIPQTTGEVRFVCDRRGCRNKLKAKSEKLKVKTSL